MHYFPLGKWKSHFSIGASHVDNRQYNYRNIYFPEELKEIYEIGRFDIGVGANSYKLVQVKSKVT